MNKKNKKVILVVLFFIVVIFLAILANTFISGEGIKGAVVKDEGVKVSVLKDGRGDISVKEGDTVSVHYKAKILDTGIIFDSTRDESFNHPFPTVFKVGDENIIEGMSMGVLNMKVGEIRLIEIKSKYAYQEKGIEGIVPPNSDLIYEIELLSINN